MRLKRSRFSFAFVFAFHLTCCLHHCSPLMFHATSTALHAEREREKERSRNMMNIEYCLLLSLSFFSLPYLFHPYLFVVRITIFERRSFLKLILELKGIIDLSFFLSLSIYLSSLFTCTQDKENVQAAHLLFS